MLPKCIHGVLFGCETCNAWFAWWTGKTRRLEVEREPELTLGQRVIFPLDDGCEVEGAFVEILAGRLVVEAPSGKRYRASRGLVKAISREGATHEI